MGNTPGLPAGYVLDQPQTAATPPSGYVLDQPNQQTPDQAHAERAARSRVGTSIQNATHEDMVGSGNPTLDTLVPQGIAALPEAAGKVMVGAAKNIGNIPAELGAVGANIGNAALDGVAPSGNSATHIPVPQKPFQTHGFSEGAGNFLGEAAQWAGMEGVLKTVATMAHLGQASPELLQIMEEHPTITKMIHEAVKGGATGGALGAMEGAPSGKTVEGAEKGALAGGAAGLATAVAPEVLDAVSRKTGIGSGLEPAEKLTKAASGSLRVGEKNFAENVNRAMPRLLEENSISKITDPEELAQAAHNAKLKIWDAEITPVIQKYGQETIDGDSIAQEIKDEVSKSVRKHESGIADRIDKWADTFKGPYSLEDAHQAVSDFNQKLRKFYSLTGSEQHAAATGDPTLGMLQDAADAMRGRIDQKLETLGAPDLSELRKQYGALNQIQRVFEKRAVVYGRQPTTNLAQDLGAIGAVMSGNPGAAVIPYFMKHTKDSGRLIRSAIRQSAPESAAGTATKKIAGKVGKAVTGAGAVEATKPSDSSPISELQPDESWVPFEHDGQNYLVHPSDLSALKERIPDLATGPEEPQSQPEETQQSTS